MAIKDRFELSDDPKIDVSTCLQEVGYADEDPHYGGQVPSDDDDDQHGASLPDLTPGWQYSDMSEAAPPESDAMTYEQLCQVAFATL